MNALTDKEKLEKLKISTKSFDILLINSLGYFKQNINAGLTEFTQLVIVDLLNLPHGINKA